MENKNNYDYITLQKATKLCSYSQEYLSLRARQGKLKAMKFGSNWVTTKEWLQEYLKRIEDYNNQVQNKKSKKRSAEIKTVQAAPPENLPIESKIKLSFKDLRSPFITVLVFVLILIGGLSEKESFIKTYNDFLPYIDEINRTGNLIGVDVVESVQEALQNIKSSSNDIYVADTLRFVSNVFQEFGQWVKEQIVEIWFNNI